MTITFVLGDWLLSEESGQFLTDYTELNFAVSPQLNGPSQETSLWVLVVLVGWLLALNGLVTVGGPLTSMWCWPFYNAV